MNVDLFTSSSYYAVTFADHPKELSEDSGTSWTFSTRLTDKN